MRAYKTELDPNDRQATMMGRCCGAARYVFNWGLAEWKRQYEAGEKPSRFGLCVHFNNIKDDVCPWVREIPYAVTESAFANLGAAFNNFFRRVKAGQKPGYPRFKKRGSQNSFQLRGTKVEVDRVRMTGIGWVRLKQRGYIPIEADFGVYATVSERAGRWFISVLVKDEVPAPENDSTLTIGVDLGVKALAVCSDGTVYENPRPLLEAQRKLKRIQRELSRRKIGGKNRRKTKAKLARQHAKIADIRQHALHNVSYDLVVRKRPGRIVIENLNISGMLRNHHLAQAISDTGFGELRRQIEYKAAWHGVDVMVADRWYPSSKTCSECGSVKPLLELSERMFVCPECGVVLDRDLNAARNLAAIGAEP